MALLLVLLFLVVPIVELYVIVQVADLAGIWSTIGLLIVISIAGSWLVKAEGLGVLRRARATWSRGEVPADEVVNGLLILFAGALLLTPGFVTDGLGLLLLLPPTRAGVRGVLLRRFRHRISSSLPFGPGSRRGAGGAWSGRGGGTYVGEAVIVTDSQESDGTHRPESDAPRGLGDRRPPAAGAEASLRPPGERP